MGEVGVTIPQPGSDVEELTMVVAVVSPPVVVIEHGRVVSIVLVVAVVIVDVTSSDTEMVSISLTYARVVVSGSQSSGSSGFSAGSFGIPSLPILYYIHIC